jgi:AcrR family transcriptional regulator
MAAPTPTQGTAPRPMRRDAVRNQELVLEAARAVISEFGTEASMDLVASRAGVGVGTVYRHFPNKDALVNELVRIILDNLNRAAQLALSRGDGTGLEIFLRALGKSLADHHGYSEKLVGASKAECATQLYLGITQLLGQAQEFGLIGPEVTVADIRVLIWAMRGIVAATGSTAPRAWERHLDIHLAALRAPRVPSEYASLTDAQLDEINAKQQIS